MLGTVLEPVIQLTLARSQHVEFPEHEHHGLQSVSIDSHPSHPSHHFPGLSLPSAANTPALVPWASILPGLPITPFQLVTPPGGALTDHPLSQRALRPGDHAGA